MESQLKDKQQFSQPVENDPTVKDDVTLKDDAEEHPSETKPNGSSSQYTHHGKPEYDKDTHVDSQYTDIMNRDEFVTDFNVIQEGASFDRECSRGSPSSEGSASYPSENMGYPETAHDSFLESYLSDFKSSNSSFLTDMSESCIDQMIGKLDAPQPDSWHQKTAKTSEDQIEDDNRCPSTFYVSADSIPEGQLPLTYFAQGIPEEPNESDPKLNQENQAALPDIRDDDQREVNASGQKESHSEEDRGLVNKDMETLDTSSLKLQGVEIVSIKNERDLKATAHKIHKTEHKDDSHPLKTKMGQWTAETKQSLRSTDKASSYAGCSQILNKEHEQVLQLLGLKNESNTEEDPMDLDANMDTLSHNGDLSDQQQMEKDSDLISFFCGEAKTDCMPSISDCSKEGSSPTSSTLAMPLENNASYAKIATQARDSVHSESELDMSVEDFHLDSDACIQSEIPLNRQIIKSSERPLEGPSSFNQQDQCMLSTENVIQSYCSEDYSLEADLSLDSLPKDLSFCELPPKLTTERKEVKHTVHENTDFTSKTTQLDAEKQNYPNTTACRPVPMPRKKSPSTKITSSHSETDDYDRKSHFHDKPQNETTVSSADCIFPSNRNSDKSVPAEIVQLPSMQQSYPQNAQTDHNILESVSPTPKKDQVSVKVRTQFGDHQHSIETHPSFFQKSTEGCHAAGCFSDACYGQQENSQISLELLHSGLSGPENDFPKVRKEKSSITRDSGLQTARDTQTAQKSQPLPSNRQQNSFQNSKVPQEKYQEAVSCMPQTAAEKTSHQPQISACEQQQCDSTVQSAQRMEDIEGEQKTVMVTGDALGPENQELCSLYFESKRRSGGGDIIEDGIKWDEKRQCFFITFVESEVAKNVASRHHPLQNMLLRVELYSPEPCRMLQPPAEACYKGRVHVYGLPDGTTSDFLQNYLECMADVSVETINLNERDNSALVIFESSDEDFGVQTLQEICQENPMEDGVNLTFQAVSDHELGAQTSKPRAVMVLGLKSETETKAIQYFFSNKKRNHGGPLENIERDPGSTKAVLHFKNLEDAESVVKKGNHVLDGNELRVKFLDDMASADGQVQKTATQTSSVKIPKMFSSNTESSAETDFRDNQKRNSPLQNMSEHGFNSQTYGQMFPPSGSQGMARVTDSSAQVQLAEFKKGKEPSSHYNEQGNQYHQTDSNECKKGTKPSSHHNQPDYQYHQTDSNLKKMICATVTTAHEVDYHQHKSRFNNPLIPSKTEHLRNENYFENNPEHRHQEDQQTLKPNCPVPDSDDILAQRSGVMQNQSPCNTSQTIRQTVIKLSKKIIQRIISDSALLQALTKNIKSVDGKFQWQRPDHILVKCLVDNPAKDWEQNVAEVISCFVSTHLQDPGERPVSQQTKTTDWREPQPCPEDSQSAASSHPLSLAGIVEQTIPNLKPAQLKILRMSVAVKKLCKDYPGLEITLDEENKTAIVKTPEDCSKKAFSDVLAFVTCLREMKIHLSPALIKMHETEDARQWIQKTLIDKNKLVCHWEVCDDCIVFCGQSAQLGQLEKMFKEVFKEVSVKVEKKELCLLKTRAWESFLEGLQEKSREGHPAPLLITVENQIKIIDIPSNISNTQLALKEFLENNKLEEVTVQIKFNHLKFLQNYHKDETKAIHEMGRNKGVSIHFQKNGMIAEGPKECLPDIVREVRKLTGKIKEDKMTFNKPGVAKHLTGAHGQEFLQQTGLTTRSFITTKNGGDGTSPTHQTGHILAEVLLSASLKLQIVQGDITKCEVDGIVNSANTQLDHAGGVAHAIVKAGGQSIQDESNELIAKEGSLREGEVVITGGGRLSCSFVLHAVPPMWNGGYKDEEKILMSTVQETLRKAEEKKMASIAMPALSCGIFRYPVQSATDTIMRTIGNYFLREGNSSCLKTLILISVTAEPLQGFLKAAKNLFGKRLAIKDKPKTSTPQGKRKDFHKPRDGSDRYSRHTDSDYAEGGKPQGPIRIIAGEIAKSRADVIVCTIHPSLDLKRGLLSKSILEEGGDVIQGDLDRYHEKFPHIQTGSVVYTSGGNLRCKVVYHVSLPPWRDDHGQKMRSAVKECLDIANKKRAKSIAFPTLGTGRLGYPSDQVASMMFSVIGQWFRNSHNTSIEDVQIVVYSKDNETLEAFRTVQKRGVDSQRGDKHGDGHWGNKHGRGHSGGRGGSTNLKINLGKVTVIVKEGNILKEPCDAIVNSSNENLDLTKGVLSKEIAKVCGPDIHAECKDQRSTMLETGVAITKVDATDLSCRVIIHVSADHFKKDWQQGVLNVLQTADSEGMASVALPALGTGDRGADPDALAQTMNEAVSQFSKQARSLKEIRVVVFQRQMLQSYLSAFDPSSASRGAEGPAVDDEMDDSSSKEERCQAVDVYIYSDKASAITEAREKIYNHVKETCTSHTESNTLIASFTPKQVEEVFKLQNKYDVDIKLDKKKNEITVTGINLDVAKAVSNFKDIMLSATAQRHQAAGMPPVRWQFETSKDKFTDFEPDNVITIEAAYKERKHQVTFSDKRGRKYKIVFKEWKEYCLDQNRPPITVRRRNLLEERKNTDIPKHWAPMNKDKVKQVKLSPDSSEYKKVAEHFGQQARIKQIERIQNPALYQQFKVKKKEMEAYNPKGTENEKRLFHGTSSDSVGSIIVNGFNRSFCGKNGTALGAGVYFAADSATSMGYAQGGQMFQARVLVGEYTQGNSGMRTAPNKPGSKRLYDSVANAPSGATVFVIFHDSQAYPEYLISF